VCDSQNQVLKMSEPLQKSSEPLRKTKRFTLPKKKLRIKASAKEVLNMITIDHLTPQEVAIRRQTSIRAVYKVIAKLKEKGLFDTAFNQVNLCQSTEPFSEPLRMRLHGQEWNIKIIQKSEKYIKSRQNANTIIIDGNTIRLYQDAIEIYSGQSFYEKDENRATAVSLAYWERFFARLEHEFGVILIKPRVQNINLVNQHYGETNSSMAKDHLERKEKIKIQTEDDGKLWFIVDNSWNLKEMETIHPETAKDDMTKVQKQLNDWRSHDPPTNSELALHIGGLVQTQTMFQDNIKTHFEVLTGIKDAIKELRDEIKHKKDL
jgi:hypothetical protein